MGKYKIQVPQHQTVEKWTSFLNENRVLNLEEVPEVLELDFSEFYFVRPQHLVSLACLIEEYYMKDVQVQFARCYNNAEKYLKRIRFFDYWNTGFDGSRYTQTHSDSTLCLWKVNREMISSFVNY